jgi:heptaprenylglyceryl phosphate synthase
MEPMFADAVFEPAESAALTEAYDIAVTELEAGLVLDEQAKTKLAKIVLAIGHLRIGSGGGLKSGKDAEDVALIAIGRFQKLRAD